MPCGGIYPVKVEDKGSYLPGAQAKCMYCREDWRKDDNYVYFCDEWDCWLHKECVHSFLLYTDAGRCVLKHKHSIEIYEA